MTNLLAMTPLESKRSVTGRVLRHYLEVRVIQERGAALKIEQVQNLRIDGEPHVFQIELAKFPDAAWIAAGDTVAFQWQDRNRKAFAFQRADGRGDGHA